jgi:hypothetical protein
MGKMKQTTPYELAIKKKALNQASPLFAEQNAPVLAARDKEDEEATTKTTRSARAKNPRLPHQKHGGDTSFSPINNMGETADSGLEKAGFVGSNPAGRANHSLLLTSFLVDKI